MSLGFPANLLISSKSSSKIFLTKTEETVSESVFSLETISFFEIVRVAGVLEEVPLVLTFKSESIFSTISRVLVRVVLKFTFSLWLGRSIKGFSVLTETDFSEIRFSTEIVFGQFFLQYGQAVDQKYAKIH